MALAPDRFQFSVRHLDLSIGILMTRHPLCRSRFDQGRLFAGDVTHRTFREILTLQKLKDCVLLLLLVWNKFFNIYFLLEGLFDYIYRKI